MIIQVFSAFWAIAMFSILTETPKRFLPYAAFSGGFAWWAYLVINNLTHSTLQATFFSILAMAFLSHILARIKKAPVTVFLIAGIFPLVPGTRIYWTAYYAVTDQLALAQQNGFAALKDALAIVLGIVVIFELPNRFFRLLARKNRA